MNEDINTWFGLSRSSYMVIPRVLLQDMPKDWQHKFVSLIRDYEEAYPNQPEIGTTVRITDVNGKLVKAPKWILNYRYPDQDKIKELKGG